MTFFIKLLVISVFILGWNFTNGQLTRIKTCSSRSNQTLDENMIINFLHNKHPARDQFDDAETGFVLYHEPNTLTIVTKYENYKYMENIYTCAVYIRPNNQEKHRYAYIDFCGLNLLENKQTGQYDFLLRDQDGKISLLDCQDQANGNLEAIENLKCTRHDPNSYSMTSLLEKNNINISFSFAPDNNGINRIKEMVVTLLDIRDSTFGLCGDYLNGIVNISQVPDGFTTYNVKTFLKDKDKWNMDVMNNYCLLSNEQKHLKTYLGHRLLKNDGITDQKTYILYQQDSLKVATKFQKFTNTAMYKNEMCTCALYIYTKLSKEEYVFVDFCETNPEGNLHFNYLSQSTASALNTGIFPLLDCKSIINNENDNEEWKNVTTSFYNYKCARLNSSLCETYLIEIEANDNIRLKVDLKCSSNDSVSYLSNVRILAPKNQTKLTSGLCGKFKDSTKNCQNFTLSNNGQSSCTNDNKKLYEFWNLENKDKQIEPVIFMLNLTGYMTGYKCELFNYDNSLGVFDGSQLIKGSFVYDVASPIIVYDHDTNVMVYAKYRPCQKSSKLMYCTCSIYIRVNHLDPHYVFIDICKINPKKNESIQFQYTKNFAEKPYNSLDCSDKIVDPLYDPLWLSKPTQFGYFKCASFNTYCNNIAIKVTGLNKDIVVLTDIACEGDEQNDYLSNIKIYPTIKAKYHSKGICSFWPVNSEPNSDLRTDIDYETIYNQNTLEIYEENGILKHGQNEALFDAEPLIEERTFENDFYCRIYNDPHIKTFNGLTYDFHETGQYILYKTLELSIIGDFRNCGLNTTCLCSLTLYIHYDETGIYQAETLDNLCSGTRKSTVNCFVNQKNSDQMINNFFDTDQWHNTFMKNRNNKKGIVDCYRDSGLSMDVTHYQLVYEKNENEKVSQTMLSVEYQAGSRWLAGVKIYPSRISRGDNTNLRGKYNGGLCGVTLPHAESQFHLWHQYPKGEHSSTVPEIGPEYGNKYSDNFKTYWEYKWQVSSGEWWNKKSRSEIAFIEEYPLSRQIDKIYTQKYQKLFKITEADAQKYCIETLNKRIPSSSVLENFQRNIIDGCIADLANTSDISWVRVHEKSLDSEITKVLLSDEENFDTDELIRWDILNFYNISCPNNCSGSNGKCVKIPSCVYLSNCPSVLKCECNAPYGSSDCSIDLNEAPEFTIIENCLDVRSLNFSQIVGVGPKFSDSNSLYYTIRVFADDVELRGYSGEVDYVFDNYFIIEYQFGYIPQIQQHSVTFMLGVSYNKNQHWQNMTVYDSNCRTCSDGNLDENLVEGTCISTKSRMCSIKDQNNGCEPHPVPCGTAFDLVVSIQSSYGSNESNYTQLIHAVSEMSGRFYIGPNFVHTGLIYNNQRTLIISNLKISNQKDSKSFIRKLNSMIYVSYPVSMINGTADKLNELFSETTLRDNVPRVALVFNDAQTNDTFTDNLQELKRNNVTVFAVGIGKYVDPAQLAQIASGEEFIFVFNTIDQMIQQLDVLTSAVCTVSSPILVGLQYYFELNSNEMRYFETSLKDVRSDLIYIELESINNSDIKLYFSTTVKNPQDYNSGRFEKHETKSYIKNGQQRIVDMYFILLSNTDKHLYLTLTTSSKHSETLIVINEF